MILGIGTDLIDCRRIESLVKKFGKRFLNRVFTPHEQKRCEKRFEKIQGYGKIYAVKEAVLKAIGNVNAISWQDIEISSLPNGKPFVTLTGQALKNFTNLITSKKKLNIMLSITDEAPYAQAFAVITVEID